MDPTEGDGAPALFRELMEGLPDVPRWVYARSALLGGGARVCGRSVAAALVVDTSTAVLVGQPDRDLLREVLGEAANPPGALLVQEDAVAEACAALPGWSSRSFLVHALPGSFPLEHAATSGVVVSDPLDLTLLAGLPDDVRADAADTAAAAVRFVDGSPVAVCTVADMSESLWDVGIDTIESQRRRGHATAVFHAMASTMAERGRQPVWAAYEGDTPSLALAARLGFQPVDRITELTPAAVIPEAGAR